MHTLDELRMKQALPLSIKIRMTQERIMTWYHLHGGSVYLSFSGGKDSKPFSADAGHSSKSMEILYETCV